MPICQECVPRVLSYSADTRVSFDVSAYKHLANVDEVGIPPKANYRLRVKSVYYLMLAGGPGTWRIITYSAGVSQSVWDDGDDMSVAGARPVARRIELDLLLQEGEAVWVQQLTASIGASCLILGRYEPS